MVKNKIFCPLGFYQPPRGKNFQIFEFENEEAAAGFGNSEIRRRGVLLAAT
jgi:hypothetical protein